MTEMVGRDQEIRHRELVELIKGLEQRMQHIERRMDHQEIGSLKRMKVMRESELDMAEL